MSTESREGATRGAILETATTAAAAARAARAALHGDGDAMLPGQQCQEQRAHHRGRMADGAVGPPAVSREGARA